MEGIQSNNKSLLSKVPEITIFFWIIKVLCTTVGETASDFLNVSMGFGLTGTSIIMGVILLIVIFFQFKAKKYIPGLYWLTVVLISIFGTLVTDNMTDKMGIPLEISAIVFSGALMLTFIIWYLFDKTLSIHSIYTKRREFFYWLAILFTFALGTASGDLMAEKLGLGYLVTGIIVLAVIASVIIAWRLKLDSVLAFWIAYIMTRPLGASIGDFLSQSQANGGLGLGATVTSIIFLSAILLTVVFLVITKMDIIYGTPTNTKPVTKRAGVLWQVIAVVLIMVLAAGSGYYFRQNNLQKESLKTVITGSPLGDLSGFRKITEDTLDLVHNGNLTQAKTRIGDLEYAWDNAEARLKPMDPAKWKVLDKYIDKVLRQLRAVNQDPAACKDALQSLISALNTLDKRN